MQIVIDIDDKVYGLLKYFEEVLGLNDKKDGNDDVKTALIRAVINGTPLPKGHGRLIDANRLENLRFSERSNVWLMDRILKSDTIVKADQESDVE